MRRETVREKVLKTVLVAACFIFSTALLAQAGVSPPIEVTGWADNSSIYINWCNQIDPLIDHSEIWSNGMFLTEGTSPIQINDLRNGEDYEIEVRNYDNQGNYASTACSPPVLTPECDGTPPMTLLLMSKWYNIAIQGSWIPQTAEVPCGTGTGRVNQYYLYRATNPQGPWTLVARGHRLTSFLDFAPMFDNVLYFYRVVTVKNGVTEPPPP